MSTAETVIAPVALPHRSSRYKHWKLSFNGPVATLGIDIAEDGGIRDGYKLKLNSYDLGVDIELHDAIQRIRFEHPKSNGRADEPEGPRVLLGRQHFHAGLVHARLEGQFCKFTNETRNG